MSEDLIFEVVPRHDTRSSAEAWPSRTWRPLLLLAPAAVLAGAFLLTPLVTTIVVSLAGWGAHYRDVIGDPEVRHALRNSIGWLAFAPLICLGGLALARLAPAWPGSVRPGPARAGSARADRARRRGDRRACLIGFLAAPLTVSALVTGIAFRLLFDPTATRGSVNGLLRAGTGTEISFLGSGWIWVVLGCAFAWQWIGLAVLVFRAGLTKLPRDRLRATLVPAGVLVFVIMLVVTARIFDLVVIVAPGSIQEQVDVAGLHWWRAQSDLGNGGTAALAVLTSLVVGGPVLACLWASARKRVWSGGHPEKSNQNASERPASLHAGERRVVRLLGVLVGAVWTTPLVVLLLTSVHTPRAAASSGWWRGDLGLDSYRQAFGSRELAGALVSTGGRALAAAILLVLVAVPAAYALVWDGLPHRVVRVLIGVAIALVVIPPQAVILPLVDTFQRLHLLGAPTSLIMVHAAFGVPPAVLLLRNAFARVPPDMVRARQFAPGAMSALLAAAALSWPVVLTVGVLEFLLVWNDFIIGLLLGGPEARQITLVLFEGSREFTTSSGVLAAGAVISIVVPMALVLATGTWLMRGLTEGVGPTGGVRR